MDIIAETTKKKNAAIDHLKIELKGLRTGRANPAMVEKFLCGALWGKNASSGCRLDLGSRSKTTFDFPF